MSEADKRPLHHSEVAKHADKNSLWVIVNGNAYDLTECESCGVLSHALVASRSPPHCAARSAQSAPATMARTYSGISGASWS